MGVTIDSILYSCLMAVLWGVTNPFIKKDAQGLENVKASSVYGQFIKELVFLVSKLKYILPFIINQCGSVLYFLTLQSTDISLAVSVSNSLTFVFTAITGWLLGEEKVHRNESQPVIAVNTKVREFETGTARDMSVLCRVRKYSTEPHWLMMNDTYLGMILILCGTTLCC